MLLAPLLLRLLCWLLLRLMLMLLLLRLLLLPQQHHAYGCARRVRDHRVRGCARVGGLQRACASKQV